MWQTGTVKASNQSHFPKSTHSTTFFGMNFQSDHMTCFGQRDISMHSANRFEMSFHLGFDLYLYKCFYHYTNWLVTRRIRNHMEMRILWPDSTSNYWAVTVSHLAGGKKLIDYCDYLIVYLQLDSKF